MRRGGWRVKNKKCSLPFWKRWSQAALSLQDSTAHNTDCLASEASSPQLTLFLSSVDQPEAVANVGLLSNRKARWSGGSPTASSVSILNTGNV